MNEEKEAKTEKPTTEKADISFEVGYGKEKTRFDLRMISVAEEEEISEEFTESADISDKSEKTEKEYWVCKNALYRFADKNAAHLKTSIFDTYNTKNERIIRRAYLMFKNGLEPESSFF